MISIDILARDVQFYIRAVMHERSKNRMPRLV